MDDNKKIDDNEMDNNEELNDNYKDDYDDFDNDDLYVDSSLDSNTNDYDYNSDDENYDFEIEDTSSGDDLKTKLVKYAVYFFIGLIVFLLLLALIFSFNKKSKKKIEESLSLSTGETYLIKNANDKFSWTSTDSSVATVSTTGEILALKRGDAIITITTDNEIVSYNIHIEEAKVDITNIKMEKDSLDLKLEEQYQMNVNIYPEGATPTNLTWYSTNDKVAVVNNGTIKAVGIGTCIITVKTNNGIVDSILVKVTSNVNEEIIKIEDISFDTNSIVLKSGVTYSLNFEITPNNATEEVIWESSNKEIATVEDGIIRTVKEGTITITAKIGNIEEICYVTVVTGDSDTPDVIDDGKKKEVEEVLLNQTEITLTKGGIYSLTATVKPNDATNQKVTWKTSDEKIVKVDQAGNLEAQEEGFAIITATSDNGKTNDCLVTVVDEDSQKEDYLTIELNETNKTLIIGETLQLVGTISPNNNVSNTITWESDNSEVASVENGLVTAKKEGSATITAKLESGAKATCEVTVKKNNDVRILTIKMNVSIINLNINGSSQLSVSITPKNATDKTISWSSSNSNIATVDNNGKVTAKKEGTTVIIAKSSNGMVAKCTVVVSSGKTTKGPIIIDEQEKETLNKLKDGLNIIKNAIKEIKN
ncbi:MAG: Ig-like domain-containing protein [Bacilli bacterium]|nr:Ig-like domain-containing protein [Bacilli bacterium]